MRNSSTLRMRCLLCLVAVSLCAADQPPPFRFYKDIQTDPRDREELISVGLDSDVYAVTRDNFPDVRVIDGGEREVPFLLEKATETRKQTVRQTWQNNDISLRQLDGGGIEVSLRLDKKDPSPDGIRFVTPLKNFDHRVQVFGSRDGKQWKPVVSDAVIFDYSRYMDVRSDEVPMPKGPCRLFRIVIDDVTAEQESHLLELTRRLRGGGEAERVEKVTINRRPFRIDRIEFWHNLVKERFKRDKESPYAVEEFRVEPNPDEKQTLIHVRTRREPLSGFTLETASRNFSRRATVLIPETRGVRTTWHEVGAATISRIDFRDLDREQIEIRFPEQRSEQYQIAIDDRDSPALDITAIESRGNVYHLVFLGSPKAKYRLVYGSESAKRPNYDTAAIAASLGKGYEPVEARLGPQADNPGPGETPGVTLRGLLNNSVFLGVVIGLLVLVLGWGLYHAGRRIDQLPGEEQQNADAADDQSPRGP